MVPGDKQANKYLTLVVQTEPIAFFLDNKIKFSTAVYIFGSRSMVALAISNNLYQQSNAAL